MPVWKLASIIFVITSVVFAGAGVLVITSIPQLYDGGMRFIPVAVAGGFVVAALVSLLVAKQILRPARA